MVRSSLLKMDEEEWNLILKEKRSSKKIRKKRVRKMYIKQEKKGSKE